MSGISKPYYTPTPLNDVFILYLLNIQKNNLSKLKNERTNERTKRTKQKNEMFLFYTNLIYEKIISANLKKLH